MMERMRRMASEHIVRISCLALAAALIGGWEAAAQPAPWQPERITAGWVFTPSVVFGGMWDSNATVRSEFNPAISEVVGLVSPRGEIDFSGRRARFSAGYAGTLESYRRLDELTRYDQRGRLEARYQMTPRLRFDTRHQLTMAPTTDQLDLGGVPFTRVGSRMLDSRGGFTFDLTRRASLAAAYTFQWVDFERDPRFALLQGGHSHSPSVDLKYQLTSRLDLGATWSYRHADINGAEQLIDTQHALAVVGYELGPGTTVRATAGVAHLRISDTEATQTGPSFGASLSQRIHRTTLEAGYERSFVPAFGFGGMTANEVLFARTAVPIASGRMFVGGSFVYRRSDPVLSQGLDIQLDAYWLQATVGYHIARWLRTEGFVSRNHQTSSAEGDVDRTRIGIQFVTSKPVRIQ